MIKNLFQLIWNCCYLGTKTDDTDQVRLKKAILTLIALIIAVLAIFWGLLYIYIGYPLSGFIPLSYSLISFISILFFFITKKFEFFRSSQFLLIFLLPFLLMWSLGGFANGSAVMIWAFFTPLAAMFFGDKKQMARWLMTFIAFTIISAIIDPYISKQVPVMKDGYNTAFFMMNMAAGLVSIYFIIMFFVNDRERSHQQAVQAKEAAMAAQVELQKANDKLQENETRIRELMLTDALTTVPNRRYLEQKMKEEFGRLTRYKHDLALVIADIDHFKSINDDFGHDVGDHVLKRFAGLLKDAIRNIDFVARIGGEEFVLILPETDAISAGQIVDRLREHLAALDFPNMDRKVTVSFGIAMAQEGETGQDCLKRADNALYDSKKYGRNRVTFAQP